jgi:PleD family two-component response regulator
MIAWSICCRARPRPTPPTRAPAGPAPDRPPADGGRRVLLVEDNVINQKVARALLERAGHHVTVAGQGAEALARIEAERSTSC